ncbi:3-hydroxyacyl-ACP dehydratase [Desulfocurvibacter africanus]|uniref:3-hydroxyacyl-ACP dehydratase n=1 Tax=Desulfocurvibacter africanus TaxID=873 RepID=UPI002FDA0550
MTLLPASKPLALPMDCQALVPHRGPMLLIDRLLSCQDKGGCVEARVVESNPFVDADGELEPLVTVELMAQAFAALKGYADLASGAEPSKGLLVSVRKVAVSGRARVGDVLTINLAVKGEFDGFTVVEGEVRKDDTLLAEGSLKLWIPGRESVEEKP